MTQKPTTTAPIPRRQGALLREKYAAITRRGRGFPPPLFGRAPDGTPYLDTALPFVSRELSGAGYVVVVDTVEAARRGHGFYPDPQTAGVWIHEA